MQPRAKLLVEIAEGRFTIAPGGRPPVIGDILLLDQGINLKTSVKPYCERLRLESERFFQKNELTVAVLLLSPIFLKKTPIF
jgi:hypothetical protein